MNYGKTSLKRRARQIDRKPVKVRRKIGVVFLASAPDIAAVDVIPTGLSTTVLASDGSKIATLVAEGSNRRSVTLDEIPKDLQHAVVAIEDERFYEHNGIDLKGIARALVADLKSMDFTQGASTITQQLVKNNVLSEQC